MPDVLLPTTESAVTLPAAESVAPPPPKKRILILMSDTGGGHRASANAIAAALEALMPGLYVAPIPRLSPAHSSAVPFPARPGPGALDIRVVDVLTEFGVWPLGNAVQDYKTLLRRPAVYGVFYWFMQHPMVRPCVESLTQLTNTAGFRRCFELHQPDLVVSVHPFMQALSLRALEQLGGGQRRVPFATVVTDLVSSFLSWFHPKADLCVVPSEELYREARRCGVPRSRLRQHGLPVRREFWARPRAVAAKPGLRQQLGLPGDRRLVVLMGGGDGIGLLEAIAMQVHARLAAELPAASQLFIVCGSNAALREKLAALPWPTVPVHVRGYTPGMAAVMAAADVLITKAGPGTLTEACHSGLLCIVSGYIPGQEAGNVSFVEKSGFGVYAPDPKQIAETVIAWLKDDKKWAALSAAASRAAQPDATLNIACNLLALLHRTQPSGCPEAPLQTEAHFVLVSQLPRRAEEPRGGRGGLDDDASPRAPLKVIYRGAPSPPAPFLSRYAALRAAL